jgi:WD40 repeat protein
MMGLSVFGATGHKPGSARRQTALSARLIAWGVCLALTACRMSAPDNPGAFTPTTSSTAPPTAAPSTTTITPITAHTPAVTITPLPTINPTDTPQPAPQVLNPANISRLQVVARRDYAPNQLVTALAWSPDGSRLAVAAGEQIHWLDGSTLHEIRLLSIGAFSRSLAFSPDGSWLAAGSQDGFIRLWQTRSLDQPSASPDPILSLLAHKNGVNQVAFHPGRPLFASGGNDAVARIWDLDSGEQISQIIGGTFAVPGLAFSPDGVNLAVMNGSVIRLRDVDSGRMAATLRVDTNLFSLAFSPAGDELAAGDNTGELWLWSQESFRIPGNAVPQAQRLATGVTGGGQNGLVWQVSFSPDGAMLGAALGDGSLKFWDVRNGERLWSVQNGDRAATSIAFRPGGARLATGGLNANLLIWEVKP